jgi:hypothetical protein
MPTFRPIAGGLPPMNPTPPPVSGGSPASVQGAYNSAYGSALAQNQANYQNVLAGYQQTAASQREASDALAQGYAGLAGQAREAARPGLEQQLGVAQWYGDEYGNVRGRSQDLAGRYETLARGQQPAYATLAGQVQGRLDPMGAAATRYGQDSADIRQGHGRLAAQVMGAIESVGDSQRTDIEDAYSRALGNTRSSMASRGLGNTTVRDAVERGNLFDRTRSMVDLSDRLAGQRAAYGTQLGLAGLGFRERSTGRQADLANQEAMARAGYESSIGQAGLDATRQVNMADLGARERMNEVERQQANLRTGAYMGIRGDQAQREGAYEMQGGLAGLGSRERGIDRDTMLASRQLDFMNSVSAPYPDPGLYAALAAQAAAGQGGPRGGPVLAGTGGGMTRSPSTGRGVPAGQPMGGSGGGFSAVGGRLVSNDWLGQMGVTADQINASQPGSGAFAPGGASNRYGPQASGVGGEASASSGGFPGQFDAGGYSPSGTAGYGMQPGTDVYGNMGSGMGGGFGAGAAPGQYGSNMGPGATGTSPYAPAGGGFGGGFGGGVDVFGDVDNSGANLAQLSDAQIFDYFAGGGQGF